MKRNMVLLIDADAKTCAAAQAASETAGFQVRCARIERDLSQITELAPDDVSAIVLDYDPDVHGPAILEVLQEWFPARPIIFVSNGEGLRHPLVVPGEEMEHLTKPVTPGRLADAVRVVIHETNCRCPSCDRWGHPYRSSNNLVRERTEEAVA